MVNYCEAPQKCPCPGLITAALRLWSGGREAGQRDRGELGDEGSVGGMKGAETKPGRKKVASGCDALRSRPRRDDLTLSVQV